MKFVIDIPRNLINSSGIYKISNNLNDMVYIGRTIKFRKRAYQHKASFNDGSCNNKILKFIRNNDDVVFTFSPLLETENIKNEEEKYIKKYKACEKGFNVVKNDEELGKYLKENKNKIKFIKTKKKIYMSEKDKISLEKGYIRNNKDNKLMYNPRKARSILKKSNIIILEEKSKKRKRENIVDFSFLVKL